MGYQAYSELVSAQLTTQVDFYAVAGHGAAGQTGFITLRNITDDLNVATLTFAGATYAKYIATGISIVGQNKILEASVGLGGATGPAYVPFIGLQISRRFT